ncbi:MAG: 50S ribosomal protein L24 [Deltaproteobacteria bacterium GWA2_47_9]|uniref:Large ribosomal subunit protein uL24 n=1 Tax=uncultured delta proteobacterium Rifle_16ft_4_minimus_809 TaxID=1665185 RepID=A0A0H4TE39_9DELT|nr:50S ribosomal protein L24, large subunit ribosomal protein L24 [uncultured delta proteobacterium Rifle_16ft_4_minimus_809]OGP12267.1 MAG: 50S ribosomal protein L24 [Deltaproteobacteria bacterium GWA2_47_9]
MLTTHVKKNDTVKVIAGKEKGKTGKVIVVLPKKERIIIEKINLVKRHTKPKGAAGQGGIIEKEGAIHISNVMVVCPKCNSAVRFGYKLLEDGNKVRVCKKCEEVIDK